MNYYTFLRVFLTLLFAGILAIAFLNLPETDGPKQGMTKPRVQMQQSQPQGKRPQTAPKFNNL